MFSIRLVDLSTAKLTIQSQPCVIAIKVDFIVNLKIKNYKSYLHERTNSKTRYLDKINKKSLNILNNFDIK